jgi:hypothetical protein
MKALLLGCMFFYSALGFAADFQCSKQVSATRIEGASISSWPHLMVSTGYRECTSGGDVGMCTQGPGENIASPYSVCFRNVQTDRDCVIKDTATAVMVDCNVASHIQLSFSLDSSSSGQISCSENGVVRKVWDVGHCTRK